MDLNWDRFYDIVRRALVCGARPTYPEDLPPDMIAFYQPPEAGQAIAMVVWVGVWFAANCAIGCMMG